MTKQYHVLMRCVVEKIVVCEDCTREEATKSPWDHAVDETDIDQVDWEVLSVKEG